jgi:mannose-6-phosphate isomerase
MAFGKSILQLKGVVQHYSWGGYEFIPHLLGIENKEHRPFAEYWMGAHGNHPAHINDRVTLNEFIAAHPEDILGDATKKKFGSLPYLLKVLDVRQMLSIQVHPSKEAAAINFKEENNKHIPVNAPHRNYKDENHKPELMVALGDFWLLHGFKPEEDLVRVLEGKEELRFLKDTFLSKGYRGLYEEVMLMPQEQVNQVLSPLLEKIIPAYKGGLIGRDSEDFWAARAALEFCKNDNYDRGIFSVYLFNLVNLKKHEAIFQGSGLPHAYLEGQNVEIMANSDNVLRAGLTDKHIDVHELLKHVKFEKTTPNVLNPGSHHKIFASPAEEFELQEYLLEEGERLEIRSRTAEVFLPMEGRLQISTGAEKMEMNKGQSIFVKSGTSMILNVLEETELFRATVPA